MNKDLKKLIKRLRKSGYEVTIGKSGHCKVYEDGVLITTISVSPSDRNWLAHAVAHIKRYGTKKLVDR